MTPSELLLAAQKPKLKSGFFFCHQVSSATESKSPCESSLDTFIIQCNNLLWIVFDVPFRVYLFSASPSQLFSLLLLLILSFLLFVFMPLRNDLPALIRDSSIIFIRPLLNCHVWTACIRKLYELGAGLYESMSDFVFVTPSSPIVLHEITRYPQTIAHIIPDFRRSAFKKTV